MIRIKKKSITRLFLRFGLTLGIFIAIKATLSTGENLRKRKGKDNALHSNKFRKHALKFPNNSDKISGSRRTNRIPEKDLNQRKTSGADNIGDEIHHATESDIQALAEAIAEVKVPSNISMSMGMNPEPKTSETNSTLSARNNQYGVDSNAADPYNLNLQVPSQSNTIAPTPSTGIVDPFIGLTFSPEPTEATFSTPSPSEAATFNPWTESPTTKIPPTMLPTTGISPIPITDSPSIFILASDAPSTSPTPNLSILTYQDVRGICSGSTNGIGCASEDPNEQLSGNPNEIVNCYNVTEFDIGIPFQIDAVRVWIGDSSPPPPDLQLNVFAGTKENGPTNDIILYSQQLFGYTAGENTFAISMDVMIFQTNFCVGVTSRSTNSGLRIQTDGSGEDNEASYLRSPECGIVNFMSLTNVGLVENAFCIEALVSFGEDFLGSRHI
mmetsp:Transcript_1006/g.2322  ORF Transcript_1006/g.2322 Transcript_1006/m.2322 type:complete len:441 (-) Transcript_1006:163-1485(-)